MWDSLVSCKSGIRKIDSFDVSRIACKIAGCVPTSGVDAFDMDLYVSPSEQRRVDKFVSYAVAASSMAYDTASFCSLSDEQKGRTATIIGSGIGGVGRLYDTSIDLYSGGGRRVSPFFIPSVIVNMAPGYVAMKFGFRGPNYSISSACATGIHCIGDAFRLIRCGAVDFALAGGAEAGVCPLGIAGFSAAKALSTKFNECPEKASRPWDEDRDGFVVGEGSGVIALESVDTALTREADIYAEIVGYGVSCDAYHMTSPSPDGSGAAASMNSAIVDAGVNPESIDYINAHGTSTVIGDVVEVMAIKKVFGQHSYNVNISSTKSSMGHLLGAAGSVEAIVCIQSILNQTAPPTLNLENPSPGCDLNFTPNAPQSRDILYAMNNSFGFGGTNGTLILKKFIP
jgi:3-oxoacyl-[acyl-carrier-protein] synthase II